LFVAEISEQVKELNLPVHWTLPLSHALPIYSVALVFLELHPLSYLVVSVVEGFLDQYHLLTVSPTSLFAPVSTPGSEVASPKLFYTTASLVELDLEELSLQHLRAVKGKGDGCDLGWVGVVSGCGCVRVMISMGGHGTVMMVGGCGQWVWLANGCGWGDNGRWVLMCVVIFVGGGGQSEKGCYWHMVS
jgi:hypothetical protein